MESFVGFAVSLFIFFLGYTSAKIKYERKSRPIFMDCEEWIPVSKQEIPQDENEILVTYLTPSNTPQVTTSYNVSYDKEGNPVYYGRYKITAWMPIPEPYKEK